MENSEKVDNQQNSENLEQTAAAVQATIEQVGQTSGDESPEVQPESIIEEKIIEESAAPEVQPESIIEEKIVEESAPEVQQESIVEESAPKVEQEPIVDETAKPPVDESSKPSVDTENENENDDNDDTDKTIVEVKESELAKIKELLTAAHNYSFISAGRHLLNEISLATLKLFYDEFKYYGINTKIDADVIAEIESLLGIKK